MKRKMMKWTAALAVALTLAGGAAGLSPAQFSLPDFSVTAEAASHYSVDKLTKDLTLSGTFTFKESDFLKALPSGWTKDSINSLHLEEGANVTFDTNLAYYLPKLGYVYFSNATVNAINEDGNPVCFFLSDLTNLKIANFYQTTYNGSWRGMFDGCWRLYHADLEIKAGQKIDNTDSMFSGCRNLTSDKLYFNNYFDTSEVKYMNNMFKGCSALTSIDMSKINLSSVTEIQSMFEGCSGLTALDLSGLPVDHFNFSNYNGEERMKWQRVFSGCDNLNRLDLPANFRLDSFMGLPYSEYSNLLGWAFSDDVYQIVTMKNSISGGNWEGGWYAQYNTETPTTPVTLLRRSDWIYDGDCCMEDLFNHVLDLYCDFNSDEIRNLPDKANVTAINFVRNDISLWDDCTGLFAGYSSLQKIDLSNVDMSGVTSTSRMFENCSSLTEFTASFSNSGKYPVNLTDMSYMFSGCKKMTSCGMYNWDLRKVTTFEGMFDGCKLLKYYEPYIQGYTDSCTNVKYMFRNCSALTHLNLGSWNLQNVQLNNKEDMFAGCSSLQWLTAYSWFGVISANMKLRNDNGGWGDNTTHTADGSISGSGTYAVISDGFGPYFHMSEFGYVINIGANIDDYPVPGKKITNNFRAGYNGYTIADSASGWYDASGNKLEKNAVFQMEGAYYLKLTLNPTIATGFREITPDVLKKIRIGFKSGKSYYDYDTKKQFVDVRAGKLNKDGTIELYCVVDSGAGNPQISDTSPNTLKTATLPGDVVYKNDDTYSAQGKIPCYRLPSIRYKAEPMRIELITQLTSSDYQNYLGYGRIEYYVSVDGGEKQSIMDNFISGLQPSTTYSLSFVNSSGERFGLRKWSTQSASSLAIMNTVSVTFGGTLGLNYYVTLGSNIQYAPGAYAEFTIDGVTKRQLFSDTTTDSSGRTKFTCNINALQMRDNINLKLYNGKGQQYTMYSKKGVDLTESGLDYSVAAYCNTIISTSTNSKTVNLAKATLDYGAAAQLYFNYNAAGLAVSSDVTNVNANVFDQYAVSKSGTQPSGISKVTMSVVFDSDNSLKVYYYYNSGINPFRYTYYIDGKEATLKDNGNGYYLEVPNIASNMLNNAFTFTVKDNKSTFDIKASVLSYARSLAKSTDTNKQNLAKSLYLYNQAAAAYAK